MPSVQILPQDRPSNVGQEIQLVTQALSNLSNVIEREREKNQERTFANIISNVNPKKPSGEFKSPFEINQEIQSKIQIDRQSKGKPGLLGFLDTSRTPRGLSPTEQALSQSGLQGLLGGQDERQQRELRQLQITRQEQEIGAFEKREELATRGKTAQVGLAEKQLFNFDFDKVLEQNSKLLTLKNNEFSNLQKQFQVEFQEEDRLITEKEREDKQRLFKLQSEKLAREIEFLEREKEINLEAKQSSIDASRASQERFKAETDILTSTGGRKSASPSTFNSLMSGMIKTTDDILSSIEGVPISLSDKTKTKIKVEGLGKITRGGLARQSVEDNAFEIYSDIYNQIRSNATVNRSDQDTALQIYRNRVFKSVPEIEQLHDMLDRNVDFNTLIEDNKPIVDDFVENFKKVGKNLISPLVSRKGELKSKKNQDALDKLKLRLATSISTANGTLKDNAFVVKEQLLSNPDFEEADIEFFENELFENPSFAPEKEEAKLAVKSKDKEGFDDRLDTYFEALLKNVGIDNYKEEYLSKMEILKSAKDVDEELERLFAELNQPSPIDGLGKNASDTGKTVDVVRQRLEKINR